MTGHEYLDNLQQQRSVNDTTLQVMRNTRDAVEGHLRKTIGSTPRIYYAGSYGKNTMLDVYHDLDIVVYYPSSTTKTLKDIYWEVHNTLNGAYVVRQKDVAIRLPYEGGFVVDVVPGRTLDDTFRYANLYRNETDGWLQTSIKVHIETVQQSNLRGTMRLIKLWNVRHNLGLRSFFVELLVARVLKNASLQGYDDKLLAVFRYIVNNIQSAQIIDPANSNNVLSDLIPASTKRTVAAQAQGAIDAQYWSQVVW
ncbi:MAG: SMODS domain-containing nucleotidyltransferase [Thermomicrobiales bacterium]